jgi:hypothetical protein
MLKYEYSQDATSPFFNRHLKITLSNGNIVRVFDNAEDMNIVELFDKNDKFIGGADELQLIENIA